MSDTIDIKKIQNKFKLNHGSFDNELVEQKLCLKYLTKTDKVLEIISEKKDNLVFMLWGNYAKNKKKFILNKNHLILESGHPSPLSANRGLWFGNKHFSQANAYLKAQGKPSIDW